MHISAIHQASDEPACPVSERGIPLFQPGAINVFATMPCPLKVRFKIEFEAFMARHLAAGGTPVYCPTILDGKPKSLEEQLSEARTEDDLPDILLTTGLNLAFSNSFRPKFFDNGLYVGLNRPEALAALPEEFRRAARDYNLGFHAFGSWHLVWDQSLAQASDLPKTWTELADPAFANQLSIHGYKGKMSATSLLLILRERLNDQAIKNFGSNIKNIWHFAEVLKHMDTRHPDRVPFNILPNAASVQIPSTKHATLVEFRDGPLLAPMLLFVKQSKLEQCRPVLDFFWGEAFRQVLARGEFFMPEAIDWQQPYTYPKWDTLAQRDYEEQAREVNALFQRGLRQGVQEHA